MDNLFENVINGLIDPTYGDVFTEAAYPDSVQYLKTVRKNLWLPVGKPAGKGNVCYLYTKTLDDSIKLINRTDNFSGNNRYKGYYCSPIYRGKLYGKRYLINETSLRKQVYSDIKEVTNIDMTYIKIPQANANKNLYFDIHKYIEIFYSICNKLPIKKKIELYWDFMKGVYSLIPKDVYPNQFVLVDLSMFNYGRTIKEQINHPLYVIYYTLFRYPDIIRDLDIDFYFFNKKNILIVNPSKFDDSSLRVLKTEMKKIMKGLTVDDTIDKSTDDSVIKKEELVDTAVSAVIADVTPKENIDTFSEIEVNDNNALHAKVKAPSETTKDAESKIDKSVTDTVDKIDLDNLENIPEEDLAKVVEIRAKKELDKDREEISKLYKQMIKSNGYKSAASSARDELLRKEQENLVIKGATVKSIRSVKSSTTTIPVTDVSKSLSTSNPHMGQIRFNNFEKEYNEKLLEKDIIEAVLALNNKSIPMFIREIKVEDSSDELNYKDTYSIYLEDANRKRHTVKVDIPKFIDDRFLYLGGNKKIIKFQNFFYPVVKIAEDTVEVVTNYNKITITRSIKNSLPWIVRFKSLIKDNEEYQKGFTFGNTYITNKPFVTTLEHDELSKFITKYKTSKGILMLDIIEANDYAKKHDITIPTDKIFIGVCNGKNEFIDINTQRDQDNRYIVDVILDIAPTGMREQFERLSSSRIGTMSMATVMKKTISVALLVGLWEGISSVLKKMNVSYHIESSVPDTLSADESYIRFKDGVLVYKETVPISMIMNGFRQMNTKEYSIIDFDTKEPYLPQLKKIYGSIAIENTFQNAYEFMLDPITLSVCEDLSLPTDIVSLILYGSNLLADSQYTFETHQDLFRVRSNEIIPAILYEALARQYIHYKNSNGRKTFSIAQNAVIKTLLSQKTVEDYSTLNPTVELEMFHSISKRGFRGINLDDSYTVKKRTYDKTMVGIISPNTPPDGNVGVARTLTMEPRITNLRGYCDTKSGIDKLTDVNVFSPAELTMPMCAAIDDPSRLAHSIKQSRHTIPVKDSSPVLISNGVEEAVRFHLSSDFVINAKESGKVIDYNEDKGIMIVEYRSGKHQAVDLSPNIVKNGAGGFYLSNKLVSPLKVGDSFKKDDVLAYHKDFFINDKYNNCRMNMGTLTKVAIMSSYNTYEDGTFITASLAERASSEMVFKKAIVIGKNSNVSFMVQKGQEISIGDPLMIFDQSYEDDTINALLASLSEQNKSSILEESKNTVISKYSGIIEDIKIYSTVDPNEMNDSLKKIVNKYYKEIKDKVSYLEKYDPDSKDSIIKCGLLMTETSKPIEPNQYGVLKGEKVDNDSVLIEVYIKHSEPLEIGSKIANFTALKNTIDEIIPKGYEPYSEFRPDEEVSTFIASNSILNRMVPSILYTALGNKCIVELKRKLNELYDKTPQDKRRKSMETLIYKFFTAMDPSGVNTKKYKNIFTDMTDTQFNTYFKNLFLNDKAYLILDVVDFEHTVSIDDITRAANVLDIPLFEHVYIPHLTMDKKHIIVTKEAVPVGYINIKRTQQTVMKKNGISTEISARSAITNQVTGKDKNGRNSDLESTMMVSMGLDATLRELNGPRSDDSHMKEQMLRDIALNGYTRLEDMDNDILNKTTLNTVDTFFMGMAIKTDLVTNGLVLPSTMKKEL